VSFFLSPDETHLSVDIGNTADNLYDVWVYNFPHGPLSRQVVNPANDFLAVWEPHGTRLLFGSSRSGLAQLYLTKLGGVADDETQITDSPFPKYPLQWASNGLVLFRKQNTAGRYELWALAIDGERKEFPIVQNSSSIFSAQISPNGKWIAYQAADDQGDSEVWLQPYPLGTGARVQISTAGGRSPKWKANGSELYYVSRNDSLIAVKMTPTANDLLSPAGEEDLFPGFFPPEVTYPYDVSHDGKRFLILEPVGQQDLPLQVVTHWQSRMKK
jgi:Tol biopolymer transport system component